VAGEIIYIFMWVGVDSDLDIIWTCNGIPWELGGIYLISCRRNRVSFVRGPALQKLQKFTESRAKFYLRENQFSLSRDFASQFPALLPERAKDPMMS
jgi:hypothetical protein